MKLTRLHLAALSVGLAIVGTMALPNTADAQRGQGGGGQGRGQGRGQGGFGGGGFGQGGFGRGGMMGGGMFGSDPLQNSSNQLLQREDVQGELAINGTQKEKMQTAQQQSMQTMRTKMQESGIDFQAMRDKSPEERQQMMQQMRTKMQEVQKTMMADQQKQVDEVLTAPQRKRLAELDLQYRGPLALADEAVAKKFNITPDQQREIGNIMTEYRTGQQEAMQGIGFGRGGRGQGGGNQGGGQPGQPGQPGQFDPAAMQARLEEGRKAMDRVKKASGDKIVALLSPAQQSAWKSAQGKPFTFKQITPQFGRPGGGGGNRP